MARIAGIATKKNRKGEITHVTIDIKKHRDTITPMLEQLGVIKESSFDEEWERGGMTVEELKNSLHKTVDELWRK